MSISRELTDAAKLLSPYIEASDRHALTAQLLETGIDPLSSAGDRPQVSDSIKRLASDLYEIVDGGINMQKFIENLDAFISTTNATDKQAIENSIRKFIRITLPGDKATPHKYYETKSVVHGSKCYVNDLTNYTTDYAPSEGTELSLAAGGITFLNQQGKTDETLDGLYAIEFMNPRFGLGSRDTPSVGIFTSLVTTLEMSRCVPYVNVKVRTSGSSETTTPTYNGISLMGFLIGRGEAVPANEYDTILSFDKEKKPLASGMELFTSPQTLVPDRNSAVFREEGRGPDGKTNNIPPILDRFRPFMTLKNLSFNVAPTKGFMSYKSAKLELVLHDRSRLGEIAYFVKPGLYSKTDIDIEYGWSHPTRDVLPAAAGNKSDVTSFRNPLGAFLNAMRVSEKYTVVNSSYNFEEGGQVGVSLTLAMKGANDIISLDISKCGSSDAAQELQSTLEEIGELIKSAKTVDGERFEKIFGDVVMSAVGTASSALSIDGEKLEELRKKINSIKKNSSSPNDQQLANKLDNLFNSTDGVKEKYKLSANEAIDTELNALSSGIEIFPCADIQIKNPDAAIQLYDGTKVSKDTKSQVLNDPISLGRVLLAFVGKPLVNSKSYDEVHFLFHTFNDKCTFMRDLSIAKFPIPYEALKKEIVELMSKNVKVSVMQFIGMLNSRFVGNNASHAYGFNFLYEVDKETGEYKRLEPAEDASQETKDSFQSQQFAKQDAVIDVSGIKDGVFKIPKLTIMPECVKDKDKPSSKGILRMHVIDETCANFSTLADLLRSANSIDISSFGFTNDPGNPLLTIAPELNSAEIESSRKNVIERLRHLGVVSNLETRVNAQGTGTETEATIDTGNLLKNKSISKTKKFVSQGIPTIRYGRDGGTINNIGLNSMSDPALTTVNILRMDKTDSTVPDLTSQRGLPMQVAPTECSIEMMGCPLLSFGQQFFIDFGTGTTADNTYNVTGIDHKIDMGSFTTSVKLTFTDSFAKYSSPARKIRTASSLFRSAARENQNSSQAVPEDESRQSSDLVDRMNEAKPDPFFTSTGSYFLIQDLLKYLNSNKSKKGTFQEFEYAVIISEDDLSIDQAYWGKNALSSALKRAAALDPRYCVITFHIHINMSGSKQVKVLNPSSKKASGDNTIGALIKNKLGTIGQANGTIVINLDDFAEEAAIFIETAAADKKKTSQEKRKKKK